MNLHAQDTVERWLHMPVIMILAIYLPAALIGYFTFNDHEARMFLTLLGVFVLTYYVVCPPALRFLHGLRLGRITSRLAASVPWRLLAFGAVFVYLGTIVVACLTTQAVPLWVALSGATKLEIAQARAVFLVDRTGNEALLRYVGVIFGRSVMPCLVTYLYVIRHRLRHVALCLLLLAYLLALEKASPLFALLPLLLMRLVARDWRAAIASAISIIGCIGLWTYLAIGSAPVQTASSQGAVKTSNPRASMIAPVGVGKQGDPRRHELLNFVISDTAYKEVQANRSIFEVSWIINRIVWIPYVTAYDWLKVHRDVLHGELNYGRSIGALSWLMNRPKLDLERIVYEYQFGPSPHGVGGANTVFFVDAKLAFGWIGVVVYCAVLALCAAVIYGSQNDAVKFASVTSFFTVSVSPLTATLLSGGLMFYVALALLLPGRVGSWSKGHQ